MSRNSRDLKGISRVSKRFLKDFIDLKYFERFQERMHSKFQEWLTSQFKLSQLKLKLDF